MRVFLDHHVPSVLAMTRGFSSLRAKRSNPEFFMHEEYILLCVNAALYFLTIILSSSEM